VSALPTTATSPQWRVIGIGIAGLITVAALAAAHGWRMPILLGLGGLLGLVLYHTAFGFTAAYRRMIINRETAAVRAQLILIAAATLLFAPVLAEGRGFGIEAYSANAPVGMQVLIGAFMFGLGMQLGNGCGSGTLFTLGGGSTRMIATVVFFCAGSFWASLDMQWWNATPRLGTFVLGKEIGWSGAVVAQLVVFAALWWGLRRWGRDEEAPAAPFNWAHLLTGGWPFLWGALALALLSWLSLMIAGHPWSITWAFSLWGAKIAQLFGWSADGVWFWTGGYPEYALNHPILEDTVSVMDIGIVLGALIAAGLAGRFAPATRLPWRSLAAAVIGGLLMGYGARIAFGCNIGAFVSGVASTSLHGWLWIVAALGGTWLGIRFRPWFGLSNP
jgi:uncharacterized protein